MSKCFKRFNVNFHGLENNNGSSHGPPGFQAHYVESRPSNISSLPVSYLHTNGTSMPHSQSTGAE